MRVTIALDLDVKSDEEAKEMLEAIVKHDARIIKGNAYDPSQKDFLPANEYKFSLHFIRHIHAVGGRNYGG